MGLPFPPRYGGLGWDLKSTATALECLGRHAAFLDVPLSLGAQMWAVQSPLLHFGSEEQKARFLAPLCRGSGIGAPAVTEDRAGSDVLAMRTQAEKLEGGYRLTGRKIYVTSAPVATLFLVWARLKGRSGPLGLGCFLISRATRGLSLHPGPADAGTKTVRLAGARVSAGLRLGGEGQGLPILLHAMSLERRFILAPALGAMDRRLEETALYARARSQFRAPIDAFQAVSHRLAEMKIRLEACRGLLRAACDPRPRLSDPLPSVVKSFVSEAWVRNCLDAIEIFGARGCLGKPDLREELRAALASRILSGTNEIQRNLIASRLLPGDLHRPAARRGDDAGPQGRS